jgi:hypothetical protein
VQIAHTAGNLESGASRSANELGFQSAQTILKKLSKSFTFVQTFCGRKG